MVNQTFLILPELVVVTDPRNTNSSIGINDKAYDKKRVTEAIRSSWD